MVQASNRHDEIFRCIVDSHIETAAPVGSQAVSQMHNGHLSSATIRHIMADLEEMGLIQQPHTSAGRVPTDKGYRHYVDSLIDQWDEAEDIEIPDVDNLLRDAHDIEEMAEVMSRIIADMTKNAGVLYVKTMKRISYFGDLKEKGQSLLADIEHSVTNRVYVDGTSNIFEQPEFRDADRIRGILKAIEWKDKLAAFLAKNDEDGRVHIYIGNEVDCASLKGVSMVVKEYCIEEVPVGCLGVMGPTRMRYDRAIQTVNKLADTMTDFLGRML